MSNDQQIEANRLNAQRSTGPRTPAGKARVSSNALKHGLTGREVVLPNENPDDFEFFRADLLSSLDPQGELEGALAEKIVADFWRLRRVPIFEATLYRRGCAELLVKQADESVRWYESIESHRIRALLISKDLSPDERKDLEDAEEKLFLARTQLDDLSFKVTRVLEMFAEPFKNLERHEAALSRSMQRTLHELERLQARRAGEHVPAPVVVDVDVSVPEPAGADIGGTGPSGETDGHQQ